MIVKKLTEKLNKIKLCAVFTTACFMISTLGTNLYATPMAENITQKYEDIFNKATCISNEYGKITSSKDINSDITVINIQDLHCHPQTQRNISKIIAEIADKYNLKKIYVEGGYNNIDVNWLNSIKDENIRKQAIEKLLEDGILTGSEYYKLTSNNSNVELKGIDEEKIHKDNVKRLSWLISQQDKYKEIIDKVTKEIDILESIYVNNRNKKFSKTIEEYVNNKINTKKFYRKLVKYIKDINNNPQKYNNITAIRLEDYPNINKFLSMVMDSDTINIKKVKTELQTLILLLKNRLPFGVYSKLLKETNNFTDNQKSLELINLLCVRENIDLSKDFKEIVKLSNLNSNNNSFNPVLLVQEERQLISEIRKAISYNNEEYEITFIADFSKFFQNYLEYKLTDTDWKYFENYYGQFKQIYSKYATVDRIKEIEQDFAEINKYYNINDKRNNIFVENLLKDEQTNIIERNKLRTNEEILKNSKEVIIAVTGGFHSNKLEEILTKKEVNTIVITPKIYEDTKKANKKYIQLIETQSILNSQALAYTLASCTTDVNKQKLLLSVVKEIIGENTKELEKLFGKQIDLSLLEVSATTIDEKEKNNIKKALEISVEQVLKNIPQKGMKEIILPNVDEIMLSFAQQLVNNGIYFSEGIIFDIENSNLNGKDINRIPAEIYARMLPSLQKAILTIEENKYKTNNEPPQLTMTFLKKLLDKTPLKRNSKIKIISIIEAPIIMLGLIFPSINDWFLKMHKTTNTKDKLEILSELEALSDNTKNSYFNSFKKVQNIIKIPIIRTIIAFSIAIIKALKVNIQGHIEFNTTAYLVQAFKDLTDFDTKYKDIFKNINLTTKQEQQIIKNVLDLKDKFNANNTSHYFNDKKLTILLQEFEMIEMMFFVKNKKHLYINSLINTPKDLEKINDLLKQLILSKIFNVETEYNMLALKIFMSNSFDKLIKENNIEYGNQSISQKYFIAIAVARYIEQVLNGNPINNKNFDEIIRIGTETYIEILKNNENKIVVDKNTKIIAISASSDKNQEFNNNGIKKLLQKLNIPENGNNITLLSSDTEIVPKIKQDFLNLISHLNADDKQVFISFDGHGFEETLILNSFVNITNEELFNALKKAHENGFDLNNLTINLSSCESWFFANSLYYKLDNFYKKLENKNKLQSKTYPTIWTAAGHETRYGYTDKYYSFSTPLFNDNGDISDTVDSKSLQVGNEWNAVLLTLNNGQTDLKIKDILKATIESKQSNFTLFVSDKNIERLCNESAKKILELNSYNNTTEEEQQYTKGLKSNLNKLSNLLIKLNNLFFSQFSNVNDKGLNLNKGYFELSIFSKVRNKNKFFELLNITAYIWEEIIFRTLPLTLSLLPSISFVTFPIFIFFQIHFIRAHNISNWIEEKYPDWSKWEILKATLLNIFPSKELKAEFKQFQNNRQIQEQSRGRVLPTMLLSVPYLYSMLFAPNVPIIILATIIGITAHKFFNYILKNKLDIFGNKIQSNNINFEQIKNIDLKEETNLQFIKHLLSSDIYNSDLVNIIIEKVDFTNDSQLNLLYELKFVNDEILEKILKKSNINNINHLSLILNLITKAGYLLSFQNIFAQIIKNINLQDKQTFKIFSQFIVNNNHSLDENNIHSLMETFDLNSDEHINLLELLVQTTNVNIDLIFNILLDNKINFNDKRYNKIFRVIIDKMLLKYESLKDAKKYFKSNILNLPANTNQGKYAFIKLIDLLHSNLIAHQNKYLKMINGHIVLRVNDNGLDPILNNIKDFAKELAVQQNLFDNEVKNKFNELMEDIVFFEKMETKTSKRIYSKKSKIADSLSNNVTIEEFCEKKGFHLIKQTPNIFFDSERYTFTNILSFLSQKILNSQTKKHNATYIMTKDSIDTENLSNIIKQFDAYMKLLDENLYVLNKFAELDDFSSQFNDVVNHINLMINYLEQIDNYAALSFRKILKNILNDIQNNNTTITEQKQLIEYTSINNLLDNITTINTLVNRIHQQANFAFVTNMMRNIEDSENAGHNVLISKNDNLISIYNLSTKKLNPQITRFLSELAENPDFSTDVKAPIFIENNIFLWVASLGAHSVRILIDFNEDSKSILIDFHEGVIDEGSNIRIKMLSNILRDIGFNVKVSTQKFNDRTLPVGIVATIDKDNGLTDNSTFNYLAKKATILFNNAAALNNLIHNKFQINQNIDVAKLEILDIYKKFFSIGLIKSNFITTKFNSKRKFNKILKSLNLPLIPKTEKGFWTFLKIGIFRIPIKTYGQSTIDKYINKPIEQAFALGTIKINDNGVLETNKYYNPISSFTEKLKQTADLPSYSLDTEMLYQGSIISQILEKDLNLTTVGQIGDYVLKAGYIKLTDGRLNNMKGDFLNFNILVDKNGIIRYSSCDLVGFPNNMGNNSSRQPLTFIQLKQLLESEGYNISEPEPFTNQELYTYRNRLHQNIINTGTPTAYGLIISKPKNIQTKGVFATIGFDTYIDEYANPDNVDMAAQNTISLFTGGSYSSHAGIVLREYNKSAMVVNNSQITKDGIKIKFYTSKGSVQTINGFQSQEIEETEIILQKKDIIVMDFENNKLLLFQNKKFQNSKGNNILIELQKYIDNNDEERVKDLLKRYKNDSKLIDKIIEYIYYQSADNLWLQNLLEKQNSFIKQSQKQVSPRKIIKKVLHINNFINHANTKDVYLFGEKESLDVTKVGTKSANQSKLFLTLDQLKKETGIKNVAVPKGMAISYNILENLLGDEYTELYTQLVSIVTSKFYTEEEKEEDIQIVVSQIEDLIKNISEKDIKQYIGIENLEIFKNKLTIVRSSGVGEDSEEYSAAGIAESFGSVNYENIPMAIKDTLLSFFSQRAINYMIKSANIIKPAILIEEWIDSNKAGIMMSEDNDGNRTIQVINGQGEDIVSGRKTPYTFIIDIKSGKKIDGHYNNESTLSNEHLEKLTKIMEWLEQAEGYPVDIEFLIKDNIIYIVQVRPITTINKKEPTTLSQKIKSNNQVSRKLSIFESFKENDRPIFKILNFTSSVWEEILFRAIPSVISFAIIALPLSYFITIPLGIIIFILPQIQFIKSHIITDWLKTKDSGWLENVPIKEIFKTSIFGLFPSKELKKEFTKYSQTDKAKQHKKVLILPTIFLSVTVAVLIFTTNYMLAIAVAIIIHLINNSNIELFGILKPININEKIKETGIDKDFVSLAKSNDADFISIYDLIPKIKQLKQQNKHESIPVRRYINPIHINYWNQQQKFVADSVGFSLGLTTVNIFENNKVNFIQPISESNNLISWERGYDYFYGNTYIDERVVPVEEYVQTIIDSCIQYNKHIFFFLPNNFMDLDTKTKREFDYIKKLLTISPELSTYFTFVVGAYDFIDIQQESTFNKFFNKKHISLTLKKLLSTPNLFMKHNLKIVSNITNIGITKFTKNIFRLSFDSILKTIKILLLLEFSKKQNITQNSEAVKQLKQDIKQNNKKQVCFICTANINRSAVAHLLFEDKLIKSGVTNISVVSAGLLPISQKNKDGDLSLVQGYKKLLEQFNVNPDLIDNFRSEEISKKHINSDYFIVVSQQHKKFLIENFGINPNKIILYSDIEPELTNDSLPDPQKLKISKIDMIKLLKNIFYYLVDVMFEEDIENINNIVFISTNNLKETKTFVIEYKSIKANELENLTETMPLTNEQNIKQVYILDNIEQLKDKFLLINTGIKIDGSSIYKVKFGNLLIYGAHNKSHLEIIKILNDSEQLKKEIKSSLSIKDEIEIEGLMVTDGNGINLNNGLLEIGKIELEGKTQQQIKEFITSTLKVKQALGIMYGQKTIIDLKSLTGNSLLKAVENGRARKVITEDQYTDLKLNKEKISELKKKGIEIYVACNEIKEDYIENGISGQIIRDTETNKAYIYDYYSMDRTELDEIKTQKDFADLENKIVNGNKLIIVDIDILKKNFQGSNIIESFTKLGALTGKIKMTMGLGNIGIRDIENVGYNIRFDEIPEISKSDIQKLLTATTKEEILNIIGQRNGFAIILTSLKDENVNRFKELIIERILAKKALTESSTAIDGVELEDKNMEIMLGKLLFRQMNYTDKETIKEKLMSQGKLMKVLEQLKELDNNQKGIETQDQQELVNTIIQLILLYDGQRVKGNQLQKQTDLGNISNYRAMLAAA